MSDQGATAPETGPAAGALEKRKGESAMKIQLDIPVACIADLMTSAIESGDPVTTAAKGGWCWAVKNKSRKSFNGDWWYADPAYYEGAFSIEIVEVDDETTGHKTRHRVGPKDMARGLGVMAVKFPHLFKEILADDIDAPCADIFLQCTLFGEEKYA